MPTTDEENKAVLIAQLKAAQRSTLAAARAYRTTGYEAGLTYDARGDQKFAAAMWQACMNNARSTRRMLIVLTRKT